MKTATSRTGRSNVILDRAAPVVAGSHRGIEPIDVLLESLPALGSETRLLLSPDGALNLIPFEALVDNLSRLRATIADFSSDFALVATLSPGDLILPLFVRPGKGVRNEIASMTTNALAAENWGNAIQVDEALDRMGADVMRWLYCEQNPSQNIKFGYGPANEVKRRQ